MGESVHEPRIILATEMCLRARVTYRKLDYWTSIGYITPKYEVGDGSGSFHGWYEWQVGEVIEVRETMRLYQQLPGKGGLRL